LRVATAPEGGAVVTLVLPVRILEERSMAIA
jgi:hypothetical protein